MKMTVNYYDVVRMLREDLREHLGPDGIRAVLEHWERYEEESGTGLEYDISLFWCWTRGTLEEIFVEQYGDDEWDELITEYRDDDGDMSEVNREAEERLEGDGYLIYLGNDEYLWRDYRD